MNQRDTVLAVSRSFVGIREAPRGSNNVIFNTRYYGREVSGAAYPWCVTFLWDVFRNAGASALFYGGAKTASSTELMNWAKKESLFRASAPRPGDIVFFNWSGVVTSAEHVGLVTAVAGSGISTIEGNTSGAGGEDDGVVTEHRRTDKHIVGFCSPRYTEEEALMSYEKFLSYMERYMSIAGTGAAHTAWAAPAVAYTAGKKIFSGANGDFGWQKPVTKETLAQIIYNMRKG
ncbi:MAG: CHAP domain-containing protein [Oscillospiraceae bacterium]|jgi:hypothetical protein|nr:CHAP domain-containing protein [Oscillospiraceae bacterium]